MLITSGELPGTQVRRLVEIGAQHGFRVKVLPSYEQLLDGRVAVHPRAVAIEDLLGRPSVEIDLGGVRDWLSGRTVMVMTGIQNLPEKVRKALLDLAPQTEPERLRILSTEARPIPEEQWWERRQFWLLFLIGGGVALAICTLWAWRLSKNARNRNRNSSTS